MAQAQLKMDTDERGALHEAALALDFSAPVAAALAAIGSEAGWRPDSLQAHLEPQIQQIMSPSSLPDIDRAARRVARALGEREVIGLVCDHDADGTTSAIIFIKALTEVFGHPVSRIRLYVSHRLNEGYGLCEPVAERILADDIRPSLILTADCGSHDGQRISLIRERSGADTVVTDHHSSDREVQGAYAFVNPKRPDASPEVDENIAGCMVAWCLMAHTYRVVRGGEKADERTRLIRLLEYAALGTVADCVDISTPTNRAVIRYGLKRMSAGTRPCWQVCKEWLRAEPDAPIRSEDIAFQIAPRIASTGRLDESRPGIHFLGAENLAAARRYGKLLDEANTERKQIQATMIEEIMGGLPEPHALSDRVIVVGSNDGHAGVQGIVASRIAETYRRPAFVMTLPAGSSGWRGSARAGDHGLCLVDVNSPTDSLMGRAAANDPGLFERFGGHHAAAGMTLCDTDPATLVRFSEALNQAAAELEFEPGTPGEVHYDAELDIEQVSPALVAELDRLEPMGKGFRRPIFAISACRCGSSNFRSETIGENVFLGKSPDTERGLRVGVFGERLLEQIEGSKQGDRWTWVVEIGVFKGRPSLTLRAAYPGA